MSVKFYNKMMESFFRSVILQSVFETKILAVSENCYILNRHKHKIKLNIKNNT